MALADRLAQNWKQQLAEDFPKQSSATRSSVVLWLMGEDPGRFEGLDQRELALARQAMDYRYRILKQRYLGVGSQQTYQRLMNRLSSLFLIRSKIRTWVSQSRDRHRSVIDVLGEVIQEMLQSDRHLQQQMAWIRQCTENSNLRNTLLLASLEEYCLRPIRNQPLLVYRFVNYLNRSQRGGLTQVPAKEMIRMISEEIAPDSEENPLSLFDSQALGRYQEEQDWEQMQVQRQTVQGEFEDYLGERVEAIAVDWLRLYLQGYTQEAIAEELGLPIKKIYRLREKVSYHAVQVFSLKMKPELVTEWLGTSVREHNLGLNPQQWQDMVSGLDGEEKTLLSRMKEGASLEAIAEELGWRSTQAMRVWGKLYLSAQEVRNAALVS
ncbi:MAG: HetZ-related protein 2 [Synechococcales cyanobacterium RM1_1_8]|nr:HetZ-related protein 2 [Synechococcales cyanobacterium RM1_1_8]